MLRGEFNFQHVFELQAEFSPLRANVTAQRPFTKLERIITVIIMMIIIIVKIIIKCNLILYLRACQQQALNVL
jgi:hypothetical protein